MSDTLEDKLKNLDISAELSASLVGGLIDCSFLASLENPNATHVICGVEWGAQTVIEAKTTTTVRSESHNVGRKPPLKPDEQDSGAIESSKKPEKENEKEHEKEKQDEKDREKDHEKEKEKDKEGEKEKEKEKEKERPKNDMLSVKVEFEIITDIADFSSGSLPTDQAGVLEFLKSIPSNLEKVNDGKGVPLKFHLVPIHEVARLFDVQRSADVVLNKLNHHHMEDVIRALDEVMRYLQECTEYEAFVRAHLFCIPRTHLQEAVQDLRAAKSQHWEFQEKFREALKDIRFGEGDVGQLSEVLTEYEGDKLDEVEHSILIQAYRAKSEFADETKNKGSVYLGLGDEKLENIIASGTYEDVYVFYFSEELRQTPRWTEHWSKVFDLLHNKAPQECVIIVDCDMSTTKLAKGFTKLCIEHWRDGNCIIPDVIEDLKELANECQIMCDDRTMADRTRTKNPPSSKRLVRIRCPGATGVGKSTFINAFRNFLEYDSLDHALEDPTPTRFVVPSYFNVEEEMKAKGYYDPSGYTFTVGNESDSEQFSKTGQSSTRYSNIYSFHIDDDFAINLTDTPGIGDTAGREQDKKNIRKILETLESIDKLSGGIRNDDTTFLFDSGVFDFIAKTKAYPNRHFNESVLERQREKWNKSSEAVYKLVQRVEDLPVHEPLTEFTTKCAKKSQDGVVKFQEKLKFVFSILRTKIWQRNSASSISRLPKLRKRHFHTPRVLCGHNDCDDVTPCHDKCDLKAPDEINKCQDERSVKDDARESLRQEQELAAKVLAQYREEEQQISAAQVLVGTYLEAFTPASHEDVLVKYRDYEIMGASAGFRQWQSEGTGTAANPLYF
ncbi:unnamed protein product [Alternaria alternata]